MIFARIFEHAHADTSNIYKPIWRLASEKKHVKKRMALFGSSNNLCPFPSPTDLYTFPCVDRRGEPAECMLTPQYTVNATHSYVHVNMANILKTQTSVREPVFDEIA